MGDGTTRSVPAPPLSDGSTTLFRGVHRGELVEVEVRWKGFRPGVGAVLVGGEPVRSSTRRTSGEGVSVRVVPQGGGAQAGEGPADGEAAEDDEAASGARKLTIRIIPRGRMTAGEVHIETAYGGVGTVLVPEDGSSSAERDEKALRHPWRAAIIRGLIAAAKVLLPLLGLRVWLDRATQPAQDAAEQAARPAVEAISPVLEAIGAVVGPVADLLGSVLGFLLGWIPPLMGLLFGWLPDGGFEVVFGVLTVLGTTLAARAAAATRAKGLERSRAQLAALDETEQAGDPRADLQMRLQALMRGRLAQLRDPQPQGPRASDVRGLH